MGDFNPHARDPALRGFKYEIDFICILSEKFRSEYSSILLLDLIEMKRDDSDLLVQNAY